ncbi:MAG: Mur ligase family protein [bacterium]|nr:Mur ligase family protein [bacterium]
MKHIHFIGICGVGMSSLAILWKKKGWRVTGSDVGFYPPISTHLTKHGIEYYPGWHTERIGATAPPLPLPLKEGETTKPDLVVVGNVAGSQNPEWQFVQDNKIPYLSYPELIAQNLVKTNSIVCAGTYGKTSTTALLAWILGRAGYNPAYMFGGLSLDLEESADDPAPSPSALGATPPRAGGVSEWSVLEGDEYKTSRWDDRAKFFSYRPTHLLLTAVEWDHADLYPTVRDYYDAFIKLVGMIPNSGIIVASDKIPAEILQAANKVKIIQYGTTTGDFIYTNIKQNQTGLEFDITHGDKTYHLACPIIGEYNAENICGAFAMAETIGIKPETIIASVNNWHGLKRRLEKRGEINGADVFDDIAHSPAKARAVLKTLKTIYSGKIFAIFEPNTGNRQAQAAPQYDQAFAFADTVIIPHLTKIKIKPGEKIIEGPELTKIIMRTHGQVKYFEYDKNLIAFIKETARPGDAVVWLGSHSFRGMIDEIIL